MVETTVTCITGFGILRAVIVAKSEDEAIARLERDDPCWRGPRSIRSEKTNKRTTKDLTRSIKLIKHGEAP